MLYIYILCMCELDELTKYSWIWAELVKQINWCDSRNKTKQTHKEGNRRSL